MYVGFPKKCELKIHLHGESKNATYNTNCSDCINFDYIDIYKISIV